VDEAVEEVVKALVSVLRGAAGEGWTVAILQWQPGSAKAWTDLVSLPDIEAATPLVERLDGLLRETGSLVGELSLLVSGSYELEYGVEIPLQPNGRLTIDPAYRFPGRPDPGGVAVIKTGETDPDALATVSALVAEFRRLYTEIAGQPPIFANGYPESEIAEAEAVLGARLPEDLRALYRNVRDDEGDYGLLDRCVLYPLDAVLRLWKEDLASSASLRFERRQGGRVVLDADRPDLIRRFTARPSRVLFGSDNDDDYLVDLDPAAGGRRGQVLIAGGQLCYLAESVTSMLVEVVTALQNGDYEVDASGTEPPDIYASVKFAQKSRDRPTWRTSMSPDRTGLADTIAGLPDLQRIQRLSIGDPYQGGELELDLAALWPLENLRELQIRRSGSVIPRIPHSVPVESLSVRARHVELGALAGHPTLWDLTLAGVEGEVDIRSLVTLPALERLDLSAVEVSHLDQLTDFGGLRVLVLNAHQWRRLRESGPCPPGLAAVERSDGSSLAEAAEWAGWVLGQEPPRVRHASGG
jgi:cell wall assembly regulator SMI1